MPAAAATPRRTWARIMAISAVGVVFGILNVASDSETPRQIVAIMEYGFLGVSAVGLAISLIAFATTK